MKEAKRPRGRPPVANPAAHQLNIRVTHAQREAYRAAAQAQGVSLTLWLERLANRASGFKP